MSSFVLLIDTEDQKGLIYKITRVLFENQLNIEKNNEFVDPQKNKFFMRTEISGELDQAKITAELKAIMPEETKIRLIRQEPKKLVLLVTKESHCLGDLLIRYEAGLLNAEIVAVIGNHQRLQNLSEKFNIPFFFISHENISREEHEQLILAKLANFSFDYLILAKYMRILSPNFVANYPEKIINIHHSFLPAFIGANPYKQAYERGVKIIGATAHFVNNHLDEGPIIFQDVVTVDHGYSWKDMQRAGQDIEKIVLAKAINLALTDRIFIFNNRTIIF